jgi:hypothetical protein
VRRKSAVLSHHSSLIIEKLFEKTSLRRSVMSIAMAVSYLPSPVRGGM